MILYFLGLHFPDADQLITPVYPLETNMDVEKMRSLFPHDNFKDNYKVLNQEVRKFASATGNGYFCRYYLAATKHFQLGRETLGIHLSYLYNRREDYPLNGVAGGITYNPSFAPHLNVIAEYDSKDFAMGATYLLFNHIHFQFELQRMKYFSGGLCNKIYLK